MSKDPNDQSCWFISEKTCHPAGEAGGVEGRGRQKKEFRLVSGGALNKE